MTRDEFITMVAGLSLSGDPDAPASDPGTDAIETVDNLISLARELRASGPAGDNYGTGPVELRDSGGGVHVYYVLPVQDGCVGVFEHIATWPGRAAAQAQVSDLEAADARRAALAADARETVASWRNAAEGFSGDDEYEAANDVADTLEALLTALRESSLT